MSDRIDPRSCSANDADGGAAKPGLLRTLAVGCVIALGVGLTQTAPWFALRLAGAFAALTGATFALLRNGYFPALLGLLAGPLIGEVLRGGLG